MTKEVRVRPFAPERWFAPILHLLALFVSGLNFFCVAQRNLVPKLVYGWRAPVPVVRRPVAQPNLFGGPSRRATAAQREHAQSVRVYEHWMFRYRYL